METDNNEKGLDIGELYSVLKRRGYFWPSFEIYGGVAGFVDLGPLGSLLRENIEDIWKRKFLLEEGFHLVDCPSINPEAVFRASGHLDKFSDLLVRCTVCQLPFRADHLLEGVVHDPDVLPAQEVLRAIEDHAIVCPECSSSLGPVEEFNLMFSTFIGSGGDKRAYLRPETAQSIFLDFNSLYRFNRDRMPFGVAQIGKGYRNEISPRQGMLRLREFHMAEGEFFFDPEDADLDRYNAYGSLEVNFISNKDPDNMITATLGEATALGTIGSGILAHFMGVTHSFATSIGIPSGGMRFRQHQDSEMAHYARDCWDLEVLTSSGWIEIVGIADRSAFDLEQHTKASGTDLTARRRYDKPVIKKIRRLQPRMKEMGPLFKAASEKIGKALEALDISDLEDGSLSKPVELIIDGEKVEVPSNCFELIEREERIHTETYTPNVIEPSFGIDRLMVSVLEHAYSEVDTGPVSEKEEEKTYRILKLDPKVAPVKVGIFPLLNKDGLPEIGLPLYNELKMKGIHSYYDASGSIGRRYARMDEIGTPFCITLDHQTVSDGTATIRQRDTGDQKRIPLENMAVVIRNLCLKDISFEKL